MSSFYRPRDWTLCGVMSDAQQKIFVDALRMCIGLKPIHEQIRLDVFDRALQSALDDGGVQPWIPAHVWVASRRFR